MNLKCSQISFEVGTIFSIKNNFFVLRHFTPYYCKKIIYFGLFFGVYGKQNIKKILLNQVMGTKRCFDNFRGLILHGTLSVGNIIPELSSNRVNKIPMKIFLCWWFLPFIFPKHCSISNVAFVVSSR